MAASPDLHIPTYSPDKLMKMPVWEVSDLGTEALQTRVWADIGACGLAGDEQIEWAFREAPILHAGQRRTNGEYIQHPLRAVLYAISYEVPEEHRPTLIAGLLMHDTVEDQSLRIIERHGNGFHVPTADETQNIELAMQCLKTGTPLTAATIDFIDRVTERPFLIDPHLPKEIKRVLKNKVFFEHTRHNIFTDLVATVGKRADVEDNGVHNDQTIGKEKMLKSDVKYYPLWDALEESLRSPDSLITGKARETTSQIFALGRLRAQKRIREAGISIDGISETLKAS